MTQHDFSWRGGLPHVLAAAGRVGLVVACGVLSGELRAAATGASATNAADAALLQSTNAAAIRQAIGALDARLGDASSRSSDAYRKVMERRRAVLSGDPQVTELKRQTEAERAALEKKMKALPGAAELMEKRDALGNRARELATKRADLAMKLKTDGDSADLRKQMEAAEAAQRPVLKELAEVQRSLTRLQAQARAMDPDVKRLTADLVEKQHRAGARVAVDPELAELGRKHESVLAELKALSERKRSLVERLAQLEGKSGPENGGGGMVVAPSP